MFIRIIQGKALLAGLLFFIFVFVLGVVSGSANLAGLAETFSQR